MKAPGARGRRLWLAISEKNDAVDDAVEVTKASWTTFDKDVYCVPAGSEATVPLVYVAQGSSPLPEREEKHELEGQKPEKVSYADSYKRRLLEAEPEHVDCFRQSYPPIDQSGR